ncbi:MAG: VanZ family protein [Acidobacteria bacterium]|nr:VanZ family protein [Acidobacteriota bacterium]
MNRRALTQAVIVSAIFVPGAPFIGEIRLALRDAFPRAFIPTIAISIAAALVIPCLVVLARVRTRRLLRYGAIGLALALVALYWLTTRTGILEVDSVELFHFLEYGTVGTLFYRAFLPTGDVTVFPLTLLAGAIVGTMDEWGQWLVPTRVGEARDVYLDLFAVACGLLFGVGLQAPGPFARLSAPSLRRAGRFGAAAVLLFAVFYHLAHLGYDIRDSQIGSFYSAYTTDELDAATADRAVRWRLDPPTRLKPLAIEDFYLTEAGSHVFHRNAYYEGGHFYLAWKENQILETYYDPFLDLHSFSSGALHRWAPAQRAEVEGKAIAPSPALYESPAGRERIVVSPTKTQFWIGVAGLVGLLLWLPPRHKREKSPGPAS